MKNILTIEEAIKTSKLLKSEGKKIVLTGGCFDILHPGHISLLKGAKEAGNVLFVMLESDEKIREIKGQNRPVHNQKERAFMLSSIKHVDYVILLPNFKEDKKYDDFICSLKPDIIATTDNDPNIEHKKRQAELVCGIIAKVTRYIPYKSSSRLVSILESEL